MSKSELLNILYAERERGEKQYSQPGWTKWALYAAIASLCWLAWGIADQCEDWAYSIFVFYGLFHIVLIGASLIAAFPKHRGTPMFTKGDTGGRVRAIVMSGLLIGLLVAQWYLIPHDFYPVLYWITFVCNCIHVLISLPNISMKKNGHVGMAMDRWDALIVLLFAPTLVLLGMYLWQFGYNMVSLRLGVLFYAIYFLFVLIPSEEAYNFDQIDGLINKVLYGDEDVDEKAVLDELETYTVGKKYGRHLSETQLGDLKKLTSAIIKYADSMVLSLQEGNMVAANVVFKEGYKEYKLTKREYDNLMQQINIIYGDKKNEDQSLTPIFEVGKVVEEVLKFWEMIEPKEKKNPKYHINQVFTAHQTTIGRPEVRMMIGKVLKNEN